MNAKQLIPSNPGYRKSIGPGISNYLRISEFFCDTIQGENFVGFPAAFLRMQGCTLDCIYCDTEETWRFGNPYTFDELFALMELPEFDLIKKFQEGQHLVLTGGSPLKQQHELVYFLYEFKYRYSFLPYIEIENECTIIPLPVLVPLIQCWNNSPKLISSQNPMSYALQPKILRYLSTLPNSWFKFVVNSEEQWKEIYENYIVPEYIKKSQVVLMPQGATKKELEENREIVIFLAINHNVRYCTREHIVVWDKKTGI